MPVTQVWVSTQEAESRRTAVQSQPCAKSLQNPVLKKLITNKGLAEWLNW
jgi:hypothetical protein